jgi:proline dehydrogenase
VSYLETPDLAFPLKADVDANYRRLADLLLSEETRGKGVRCAIATHDEAMIRHVRDKVARGELGKQDFEFQMLYGIRRHLQRSLAEQGYRVRIYVSYGTQWYPYFMRRLAERPANVLFLAKNVLRG